jgi:hypothetical protein
MDRAEESGAKLDNVVEAVRSCIESNPGVAGAAAVCRLVSMRADAVRAAVTALIDCEEVVERKGPGRGNSRRLYLAQVAPPKAE